MAGNSQPNSHVPRSCDRSHTANHHGFTLVEVMSAVMLGGVLVTATAVVAVQSVSIRKTVESTLMERWQRVRLFDQLEADVDTAPKWLGDSAKTLVFPEAPDRLVEILGLISVASPDSLAHRRMPGRIAYVMEESGVHNGYKQLVRETVDLTQQGSDRLRKVVGDRLIECRIWQYRDNGWNTNTGSHESHGELPAAVRLTCRWDSTSNDVDTRTITIGHHRPRGQRPGP